MTVLTDDEVAARLAWEDLIPALRSAFSESHLSVESGAAGASHGPGQPARASFRIPGGHLLAMPSWGAFLGVKIATILPDQRPSVQATYVLLDRTTGERLAVMAADSLTRLRTAATSALASSMLSRPDAGTLLMIGAGRMASALVSAHVHVRPISRILLWNRTRARAEELASDIRTADRAKEIRVYDDLPEAVRQADILCAATLSTEPLIALKDVRPGTHVDLVGAFTPEMRESDSALIAASQLFVDERGSALKEAGDVIQAVSEQAIRPEHIQADLFDLCASRHPGRRNSSEITVFKSVGNALEDLVAASLVYSPSP
jgi:ornithine cyclodeaminase